MKNLPFLIALIAFATVQFISCDSGSVEPPLARGPDTTSHNFTWQTFILGDGNSSNLSDVFIISENNIWAVGEMYLKDSAGVPIYPCYNAAHWDGSKWQLERAEVNFRGNVMTLPGYGIFAFSETDIWIAAVEVIQGNGKNWIAHDVRRITGFDTLAFKKCWGTSSSSMYFVGLGGSVAYYDGATWKKLDPGTRSNISDIDGLPGPSEHAYATVPSSTDTRILSISSSQIAPVAGWPGTERVRGIYLTETAIYVSGFGAWRTDTQGWRELTGIRDIFFTCLAGQSDNDIVTVGWDGVLLHYNGSTWHQYSEIPADFSFEAVHMRQNVIAAVGFTGGMVTNKAAVVIGRRTQ